MSGQPSSYYGYDAGGDTTSITSTSTITMTYSALGQRVSVNIKVVSARLGHSSIQITLDSYMHLLPEMEQHAAAIGEALKMAI